MFPPSAVSDKRSSLFFSFPFDVPSSTKYRLKVLSLGAAVFALLIAYLSALVLSAGASGWLLLQIVSGGFTPVQGLGLSLGVGTTALLSFVLAKGLFRRSCVDRSEFIELHERDEPEFFAFLHDIYSRCGAPAPDRVFACPDVNAGVFMETSIIDVFRPPRRNLLVGMGMVNALNRTELEAVLAHEFGHFSQRSMRLHDYVRVVTGILEEIICGRDRFDLAVARWHDDDDGLRTTLSSPLSATTALVRRVAGALLAVIRRMEASLSRQMELEADRVAVQLTGSDALIHALKRTDWADRCFSQTLYDLEQALGDGIRTDDLFYHQMRLGEAMRQRLDDPKLGIPPELPDDPDQYTPVFTEGDDGPLPRADHWDSHPPHQLREKMARRDYRRSTFDERSAWTLFSAPRKLRHQVTERVYTNRWHGDHETAPAEQVQRHLDGEHAEVILDGDDRIVYGHRFIEPGPLEEALATALRTQWSDRQLAETLQQLTGPDFEEAARRIERHLGAAQAPEYTPKATGARPLRNPATATAPSSPDATAAEEDHHWLADWDRRLLIATICAARRQGDPALEELIERYQFHLHLQDMVRWQRSQTPMLASLATTLEQVETIDEIEVDSQKAMLAALQTLHTGLQRGLQGAPPVPELHGLPEDPPLSALVLSCPLIATAPLDKGCLDKQWVNQFVEQWKTTSARIDHLRRKSLGALLLFQRQLHARTVDRTPDAGSQNES